MLAAHLRKSFFFFLLRIGLSPRIGAYHSLALQRFMPFKNSEETCSNLSCMGASFPG